MPPNYLDIKDVCALCGVKRWTIYRYIRDEAFPKPSAKRGREKLWLDTSVVAWMKATNRV